MFEMAFPPFHTKNKRKFTFTCGLFNAADIQKHGSEVMDYYFALKLASKIEFWCEKVGSTRGSRPFDKNIEMRCTWKWTPWLQWIYHKNTVLRLRTDDSHVDGFLFNGFVLTLFVDVCLDFSIAQYMEDWYLTYKKILLSRIRKENISQTN